MVVRPVHRPVTAPCDRREVWRDDHRGHGAISASRSPPPADPGPGGGAHGVDQRWLPPRRGPQRRCRPSERAWHRDTSDGRLDAADRRRALHHHGPPPPAAVGEAERIRAMDPAQVARSVASEDAAARPGSVPGSAVKGVWRVGAVGTYLVGKGIAPGTYESAGATQGSCQWSRLRDLSGTASSVIQRGSDSGTSVVTIRSSDAFFETSHCQNWHKIA